MFFMETKVIHYTLGSDLKKRPRCGTLSDAFSYQTVCKFYSVFIEKRKI
jgi:hypothetical protein